MTKPRSAAALVAALRTELEQARSEGVGFFVASWQEADADAGYLVRTDGAMVPIGEYQYGFAHVDELAATHSDAVTRDARQEAGRILGGLEPLDDHREFLVETMPALFLNDADVVERAVADGRLSVEDLFSLLHEAQGMQVTPGAQTPRHAVSLLRDVSAVRLSENPDGSFSWTREVVLRAGDTVEGQVLDERAFLPVPGGMVTVAVADTRFEPLPTRSHRP